MKRFTSAAALAITMTACDVPDSSLLILGVPVPDESCSFQTGGTEFFTGFTFDTSGASGLSLALEVRNDLNSNQINAGSMMARANISPPNNVSPLRFEARWECDSNGFSGGTGPLILPGFDPNVPFCLDKRGDANDAFTGFDFVNATGPVILAGGSGIAVVNAIPPELGRAFDDLFTIAALADSCCKDSPGCSGQATAGTPAEQSCGDLEQIFRALDPDGRNLQVSSGSAGTRSEDLVTFLPFSRYEGNYSTFIRPDPQIENAIVSPRYLMRYRGVLEGITGGGTLVRSQDFSTGLGVCRACGQQFQGSRLPAFLTVSSMGGLEPTRGACLVD
jgi:hypothetical protein